MNQKVIISAVTLAVTLGGGIIYSFTNQKSSGGELSEQKQENAGGLAEGREPEEKKAGQERQKEPVRVKMSAEMQKQNGVVVAPATTTPVPAMPA